MKTSKLVSAFAISFFIIATVTASASGEVIKILKSKSEKYYPLRSSIITISASVKQRPAQKGNFIANPFESSSDKDLSYLKFNVGDYTIDGVSTSNEINSTIASKNAFDYLKFDVTDYMESDANVSDRIEMPSLDVDYLKFSVNNFIDTGNENSVEISDLPANEFSYLKFDVNQFSGSNTYTDNSEELPITE
jgi:hypothetical protein